MINNNRPQRASSSQFLREMAFSVFFMGLCGCLMYAVTAYRLGGNVLRLGDFWLGAIMMLPIPHIPHIMGYFSCIIISGGMLEWMNITALSFVVKTLIRFFVTLTFFILFFGAGLACYSYDSALSFPVYKHAYCGVITLSFSEVGF